MSSVSHALGSPEPISQRSASIHREQESSRPEEDYIPSENDQLSPSLVDLDPRGPALPDDTLLSIAGIVGGFLVAVALAVGHHIFLSYLEGQNVEHYSQFWVKNASNGFSNVFSICVGFSATCALIQIKWRVASRRQLSIKTIDNLFALPAPLALLGTFIRPLPPLFLPIVVSTFIHALLLVSILAPNALTISRSTLVTKWMSIPTLDLQSAETLRGLMANIIEDDTALVYVNISIPWKEKLNAILLNPPEINWTPPLGCGSTCTFDFKYDAPALECRDIPHDEYTLLGGPVPYRPDYLVYEANITLSPNLTALLEADEDYVEYGLSIEYAEVLRNDDVTTTRTRNHETRGRNLSIHPGGGVDCHFRNATYKASYALANNTQRISTSILSYDESLSAYDCTDPSISGSIDCSTWWPNTWAMCYAFATALQGVIISEEIDTDEYAPPVLVQSLFTTMDPPFSLAVSNLSESLVDLFSNLTLGLIPHRDDVISVRATVWDGTNIWDYKPRNLWAVYTPALLLGLFIILQGIYCIQQSKIGMDDKFSSFLLTTRGDDLDDVCKQARDFKALQRVRLIHQVKDCFVVKSDAKDT